MSGLSDIGGILTCNLCECFFESAIILPCFETMCLKHVEELKSGYGGLNEEIKCHFCGEQHQIPRNGFANNKQVTGMIQLEYHKIELSKSSLANDLCKKIDEIIAKYENLNKEPENYIQDYFQELINQIDLRREEIKLDIDEWHEERLEEIQKYKTECLEKLNKEVPLNNDQIIKEFKGKSQSWKEKLKISEIIKKEFSHEKIEKDLRSDIATIKQKIAEYKENLLRGNTYEFEDTTPFSTEDLGQINVKEKMV